MRAGGAHPGGRAQGFSLPRPPPLDGCPWGWAGRTCRRTHLSTTKAEALWLTEAECSAHRPLGSSRVWMV